MWLNLVGSIFVPAMVKKVLVITVYYLLPKSIAMFGLVTGTELVSDFNAQSGVKLTDY